MVKIFCTLLLLPGFVLLSCAKPDTSAPCELYALQYGTSMFPEEYITTTVTPGKRCPFSWSFYLLKTEGRVILVDTGFTDRKYVKSFHLTEYYSPLDLLKRVGVSPDAVTDILLTHSHFDHIGSVHHFPEARIYIQRREYEAFRATTRYRKYKRYFASQEKRGLLRLLDGEFRFSSAVQIIPAGGHTAGSQGVIISSGGKKYYIAGDECYLRKYCETCRVLPERSSWSRKNNLLFLRRILSARQKTPVIILPMHDPVILKEYPVVTERVNKIF